MLKRVVCLVWAAIFLIGLVGCGGGAAGETVSGSGKSNGSDAQAAKADPIGNEPLTLTLYQNGLAVTDDDFANFFANPTKKKYPNITLELVRTAKGSMPEDLVAAGTFPDIIFAANPVFNDLKRLGVLADLNDLVKKYNVDLTKFDPTAIETTKLYGDKGELYALPFVRNYGALFYSKDLFDKFGVGYPKDGMDWDQIMEITRKMSRISDGVQIRGFEPPNLRQMGQQMSLPHIDAKTNKVTINNDGWKRGLQYIQDVYGVANNLPPKADFSKPQPGFIDKRNVAMITGWVNGLSGALEDAYKKGNSLDWDLIAYPNFKEKLGTGRNVDIQSLLLSSTTKHKDQAFAVINLLTSEDAQVGATRTGRLAAMNAPEIEKQYAADLQSFKGKNITGIFKTKPAALAPPSDYDQLVYTFLTTATTRAGLDRTDINTVLRETEADADKAVQAEIEKRK